MWHHHLEQLPTPIAVALEEYRTAVEQALQRDDMAYVALHRLVDAAELVTRFLAIVALCDVEAGCQELPEKLRDLLVGSFRRPTFGNWLAILDHCTQAAHPRMMPELDAFWTGTWKGIIGTNDGSGVLALRNRLAHGGRISDQLALDFLSTHRPLFDRGLEEIAFLGRYDFLAVKEQGRAVRLQGTRYGEEVSCPPDARPGDVCLDSDERYLSLFPLQCFRPAAMWDGLTFHKRQDAASVPLLYLSMPNPKSRHGKDVPPYIEFSTASDTPFARDDLGSAMLDRFDLENWDMQQKSRSEGMLVLKVADYEFLDIWKPALPEDLVGRRDDLNAVVDKILELGPSGGCLWIAGVAGVGKTAFTTKLLRRLEGRKNVHGVPFFFRRGDRRCHPDHLYRAFMAHAKSEGIVPDGAQGEPTPEMVTHALRQVARLRTPDRSLVLVIDGLDEVIHEAPGLLGWLKDLACPGLVVVLAGRPSGELAKLHEDPLVQSLWPDARLPRLKAEDVRDLLQAELGAYKYDLCRQDQRSGDGYRNPVVDVLVERTDGLPVYLKAVIEEIKSGKLALGQVSILPRGIDAYYEREISRQQGDLQKLSHEVLCLLALAREPMTFETIAAILLPPGAGDCDSELLDHVLLALAPFMDVRYVSGGEPTWRIYHDGLRTWILDSSRSRLTLRDVKAKFHAWCMAWRQHAHPYALRNLHAHLEAWNEHGAILDLAMDEDFLAAARRVEDLPGQGVKLLDRGIDIAHEQGRVLDTIRLLMLRSRQSRFWLGNSLQQVLARGQLRDAWELADMATSHLRPLWYLFLAVELVAQDRQDDAVQTLEHVIALDLEPLETSLEDLGSWMIEQLDESLPATVVNRISANCLSAGHRAHRCMRILQTRGVEAALLATQGDSTCRAHLAVRLIRDDRFSEALDALGNPSDLGLEDRIEVVEAMLERGNLAEARHMLGRAPEAFASACARMNDLVSAPESGRRLPRKMLDLYGQGLSSLVKAALDQQDPVNELVHVLPFLGSLMDESIWRFLSEHTNENPHEEINKKINSDRMDFFMDIRNDLLDATLSEILKGLVAKGLGIDDILKILGMFSDLIANINFIPTENRVFIARLACIAGKYFHDEIARFFILLSESLNEVDGNDGEHDHFQAALAEAHAWNGDVPRSRACMESIRNEDVYVCSLAVISGVLQRKGLIEWKSIHDEAIYRALSPVCYDALRIMVDNPDVFSSEDQMRSIVSCYCDSVRKNKEYFHLLDSFEKYFRSGHISCARLMFDCMLSTDAVQYPFPFDEVMTEVFSRAWRASATDWSIEALDRLTCLDPAVRMLFPMVVDLMSTDGAIAQANPGWNAISNWIASLDTQEKLSRESSRTRSALKSIHALIDKYRAGCADYGHIEAFLMLDSLPYGVFHGIHHDRLVFSLVSRSSSVEARHIIGKFLAFPDSGSIAGMANSIVTLSERISSMGQERIAMQLHGPIIKLLTGIPDAGVRLKTYERFLDACHLAGDGAAVYLVDMLVERMGWGERYLDAEHTDHLFSAKNWILCFDTSTARPATRFGQVHAPVLEGWVASRIPLAVRRTTGQAELEQAIQSVLANMPPGHDPNVWTLAALLVELHGAGHAQRVVELVTREIPKQARKLTDGQRLRLLTVLVWVTGRTNGYIEIHGNAHGLIREALTLIADSRPEFKIPGGLLPPEHPSTGDAERFFETLATWVEGGSDSVRRQIVDDPDLAGVPAAWASGEFRISAPWLDLLIACLWMQDPGAALRVLSLKSPAEKNLEASQVITTLLFLVDEARRQDLPREGRLLLEGVKAWIREAGHLDEGTWFKWAVHWLELGNDPRAVLEFWSGAPITALKSLIHLGENLRLRRPEDARACVQEAFSIINRHHLELDANDRERDLQSMLTLLDSVQRLASLAKVTGQESILASIAECLAISKRRSDRRWKARWCAVQAWVQALTGASGVDELTRWVLDESLVPPTDSRLSTMKRHDAARKTRITAIAASVLVGDERAFREASDFPAEVAQMLSDAGEQRAFLALARWLRSEADIWMKLVGPSASLLPDTENRAHLVDLVCREAHLRDAG